MATDTQNIAFSVKCWHVRCLRFIEIDFLVLLYSGLFRRYGTLTIWGELLQELCECESLRIVGFRSIRSSELCQKEF